MPALATSGLRTLPETHTTSQKRKALLFALGVVLLVLVGGYFRLVDLGSKSITHPEMYVPGIHLPEGLSQPRQRLTLVSVLTGTFSSDTHPPGFYILMWLWTKLFGAGIWSIRLPAALLGIGCILLVLWLGRLAEEPAAAWLAAGLLAVNGHQVFWSQVARMFSLACFLGLLATTLLVLLSRTHRPSRKLKAAYVLVLFLGLASHVFFWTVLGTHLLWSALNGWGRTNSLPTTLRLQLLAFLLGSPLLAFAAYQSGTVVAPLSGDIGIYVREFVQFAFLFPLQAFSSGVFLPSAPFPPIADPHLSPARAALVALSLALLLIGLATMRKSGKEDPIACGGPGTRAWLLAAALATLAIVAFVLIARAGLAVPNSTLGLTKAFAVVPFILAALALVLQRSWERADGSHWLGRALPAPPLVAMMAVVPFTVMLAASTLKPMLNARGMVFLGPYLLLVLAAGIVRLARYRALGIGLALLLGVLHGVSLLAYKPMAVDPADYKAVAGALSARYQPGDIVFLQPVWYQTPFLYYLPSDRFHLVGGDYQVTCHQHPHARVWLLLSNENAPPPDAVSALHDYKLVDAVKAPHAQALLYSPQRRGAALTRTQ